MTPGIAVTLYFGLASLVFVLSLTGDAERMILEDADNRIQSENRVQPKPKEFPEWYMETPQWIIKYIWPANLIIPKVIYCVIIVSISNRW